MADGNKIDLSALSENDNTNRTVGGYLGIVESAYYKITVPQMRAMSQATKIDFKLRGKTAFETGIVSDGNIASIKRFLAELEPA